MASTLVQAVNANSMNERQTVCWSQDDRLAVSTEKEIIISKIDIFRGGKTFKGSAVSMKVKVSMADLTPKADPWPGLQEKMRNADKAKPQLKELQMCIVGFCYSRSRGDVQKKVRQRWTYSSLGIEPHSPCWTALRWSPPGLAPNNRTVLVGLTTDHRIIITGMSATGREWVQLADLLDQLVLHQQEAWEQQQQDEKGEQMYSEKCNAAVLSAYASMLPLAAVDVQWSHVMEEGAGQGQCVLLFAVMKNADIVTWSITLPCAGIDSCRIVDRQRAGFDGIVSSLSWTCVPDDPQAGLLAVGYMGGRVEVLCYSVDPNASPDASPHRFTHLLHPGGDYLPVSALAWTTAQQNSLVLLSSKEQTTCAQVVSVSCHGNRVSGVGKGGDQWKLETGACCHVALGNFMAASGIVVFGDMVLMSAGESVYHLAVTASPTEVKVGTVREVPFQHTVRGWGCLCLDLSPNAALAVALFRPMFAYNHRNADFRSPIKVHICPVRTDWNSLESLMLSTRVSTMSTSLIDLLELAAHVLHPHSVTTETVAMVMHRLTSSPFSDTPVGWRLARHIFSVLKSQCEKKQLTEQVQVLASAERKMTERLLCGQISQVCLALRKTQPQVNATDVSTLNMMLNWVRWSEERSEALGSELIGHLSRAVGRSQPEVCALCGEDVDLTDGVTVSCSNSHKFGLCCHSLAVCNTVAYQCCMTCGVLALSPKTLKGLPCMGENCSRCTLCQSYLYSTNSSVRL